MPAHFLKQLFLIFGIILPAWIFYRLLKAAHQKRKGKPIFFLNEIVLMLFVIYVSVVLAATIVPASLSGFNNPREPGLNVIPVINTYQHFVDTLSGTDKIPAGQALENILGNIVLFIPLGIFLPVIFHQIRSFKKVAAICFLCSFSIELFQLLLRQFGTFRTVDIDDIILNTIGGMLGWLIFVKIIARYLPKRSHPANG